MEPERKIEKWLKAYAKKRRTQAGEPFKLHSAARRLLQGAVARDKPKPEEDESVSLWDVLRQRWAILLSFAACVFLVAIIFFHPASMAKKKTETVATLGGPAPAVLDKAKDGFATKGDFGSRANGNLDLQANTRELPGNTEYKQVTNGVAASDLLTTATPGAAPELSRSIAGTPIKVFPPGVSSLSPSPVPVTAGGNYTVAQSTGTSPPAAGSLNGIAGKMPVAEPPSSTMVAFGGNTAPPPPTERAPESIPAAVPPVAAAPSGAFPSEQPSQNALATAPQNAMAVGTTFSSQGQIDAWGAPAAGRKAGENLFQNSIAPSQAGPVLANFHVLQNGNAIRIVDQDGSVYDGSLQVANQEAQKDQQQNVHAGFRLMQNAVDATTGLPGQQVAALGDALKVAQSYFFRVYGTNRTMKQSVVFTGNLVAYYSPATNTVSVSGTTGTFDDRPSHSGGGGGGGFGGFGEGGVSSKLPDQSAQLPWSNLRITGKAVINQTNQIEINAAPIAPAKN